jgi:hypothetical protein
MVNGVVHADLNPEVIEDILILCRSRFDLSQAMVLVAPGPSSAAPLLLS